MPTVASRINGERLVVMGWPCAILMQVAHPLIAAGVFEHSTFRESPLAPLRRLHGTVKAMLGLSFGTAAEQASVIGGIRSIHTRVNGTLSEAVGHYAAGTRYSAEDPALVLWVHATLIVTSTQLYELTVADLTDAERDEYCRESAPIAIALGADPGSVPRSYAAMTHYVDQTLASGGLVVGPEARQLADALLNSRVVGLSGPGALAIRLLARGLMPDELRRQYGFSWTARDERRFRRLISLLRHLRQWTPRPLARWRAAYQRSDDRNRSVNAS